MEECPDSAGRIDSPAALVSHSSLQDALLGAPRDRAAPGTGRLEAAREKSAPSTRAGTLRRRRAGDRPARAASKRGLVRLLRRPRLAAQTLRTLLAQGPAAARD